MYMATGPFGWLGLVWLAGGTGGGLQDAPATSPATSPAKSGHPNRAHMGNNSMAWTQYTNQIPTSGRKHGYTWSFSSADIPSASGCLICPDFIRTAQLVQQPDYQKEFSIIISITRNNQNGDTTQTSTIPSYTSASKCNSMFRSLI